MPSLVFRAGPLPVFLSKPTFLTKSLGTIHRFSKPSYTNMEPKGFVRDVVLLLVTMLLSGVAILYLRASSPNTRWADSSASWASLASMLLT